MQRYPKWMQRTFSPDGTARSVRAMLEGLQLTTVCESALCPNLRECYSQGQLTFMILGDCCTRSCRFCAVDHGRPEAVAADEPHRLAEAVRRLGLRHVVITSVARDDLADEGASHFVSVLRAVRKVNPGSTVEVLVPDFHARRELIQLILEEGRPEVFAHNLETVERLSDVLRPQATYRRSLEVLRMASGLGGGSVIKSNLMVGLGETAEELIQSFQDLRASGVTHLTVGQYLRPDADHLPVMEYVSPERFRHYEQLARDHGFAWVLAGPYVRSSYHAVDAVSSLDPSTRAPALAGGASLGMSPQTDRGVVLSERSESKDDENGAPGLPEGLHSHGSLGASTAARHRVQSGVEGLGTTPPAPPARRSLEPGRAALTRGGPGSEGPTGEAGAQVEGSSIPEPVEVA